MRHIVIIVTLDTKSVEAAYLRDRIIDLGHKPLIVDVGCGGLPKMDADIRATEIAAAGGADLESLRASRDRDMASAAMIRGAVVKLTELCRAGKVEGFVSIGGMSSAVWTSSIYREMPYRVPKLLVTTAAAMPQANRFFGPSGVTVMHSLVEVGALNRLLMGELARAAGAICGMAEGQELVRPPAEEKPMVAMSTNGWVETPAQFLAEALGGDYEIVRFHGTGLPEVVMEKLIEEDYFKVVIDLVPSSITNERFHGSRISWPRRMEVAGEKGIPQVIAPSLVNVISRPRDTSPELLEEMKVRKYYFMDSLRILLWLSQQELESMAHVYAKKLNKAQGPTVFLVPLRGWLNVETEDSEYFEPEALQAFSGILKREVKPEVEIREIDVNIDTTEFGEAVLSAFRDVLQRSAQKGTQ
ncbi:MAG: Tm-1-like ATP-binding domain-containing protein [Actinobacteria bacterium]|nr:Tm-1-like ATP-binding domain-containing protein [Actinomycetota bacterium]